MPIPKPTSAEKKREFLSRCMSDSVMRREYKESDNRYAICQKAYNDSKR